MADMCTHHACIKLLMWMLLAPGKHTPELHNPCDARRTRVGEVYSRRIPASLSSFRVSFTQRFLKKHETQKLTRKVRQTLLEIAATLTR
eukprot:365596-Chlamydomonas_euryale.AAC.11